MAEPARDPSLAFLAGVVALAGVVLYFLGVLITQSSPDASGEGSAYCHCLVVGGEALLGGTLSLIGLLMVPMALVVVVWGLGRAPPLPAGPHVVDER